MKKAVTENETGLLECLHDVICQSCSYHGNSEQLDSMAISAYADGMRLLAGYGKINIVTEYGRSVIAEEAPQDTKE